MSALGRTATFAASADLVAQGTKRTFSAVGTNLCYVDIPVGAEKRHGGRGPTRVRDRISASWGGDQSLRGASMSEETRANALHAAMRAFGEAWARGDTAALTGLLSPSYTHNDAAGEHFGRDSWLAYAAKRTDRGTQIAFREVEIRVFGDLAVVTGFNDLSGGGVSNSRDNRDLSIAFTQVWRQEDGRWLREAFQATPVRSLTYE